MSAFLFAVFMVIAVYGTYCALQLEKAERAWAALPFTPTDISKKLSEAANRITWILVVGYGGIAVFVLYWILYGLSALLFGS